MIEGRHSTATGFKDKKEKWKSFAVCLNQIGPAKTPEQWLKVRIVFD